MIIYIDVIAFKKIICHINIHPAILINITDCNTQTKCYCASINTSCDTNIGKFVSIVSEKLMPPQRITDKTLILFKIKTANCFWKIFQKIHVKITVLVVVKKYPL